MPVLLPTTVPSATKHDDIMSAKRSSFLTKHGHAIGLTLFALASLGLLICVWVGHLLGTAETVLLLGVFLAGGGITIRASLGDQNALPPAPPVPVATVVTPPVEVSSEFGKTLAEIAVLAWKIEKRAQKEPNPPKAILRNAARIIEVLGQHKVELVSYEGRRIFMGSDVDVLEAVEDVEEDKVVEQHEPEIQLNGKLVRRALLTVGKKRKPANTAPTESPTSNQPEKPDKEK